MGSPLGDANYTSLLQGARKPRQVGNHCHSHYLVTVALIVDLYSACDDVVPRFIHKYVEP